MPDGPHKILSMANTMGIPPASPDPHYPGIPSSTRDLEPDCAITLGSATISPINMANAYATIANGGQRADVHVINKVTPPPTARCSTSTSRTRPRRSRPTSTPTSATRCSRSCKDGTGTNAQALGRPAAGKTGTATNADDDVSSSWFVGYTPQCRTAVMYVRGKGNDQLDGWLPRTTVRPATSAPTTRPRPGRGDEGRPARGSRSSTSRPRPTSTARRPTTRRHAPYVPPPPTPTVAADQERADHRGPRPERRRPRRPRPPSTPPTSPTTPTVTGSPSTSADVQPVRARRARDLHGDARALAVTARGETPRAGRPPDPGRPDRRRAERGVGGPVGATPAAPVVDAGAGGARAGRGRDARWGSCRSRPATHASGPTSEARYAKMCYSDMPYLYVGRGFAEGRLALRRRPRCATATSVMEYPVGISYFAWGAAKVTALAAGSTGRRRPRWRSPRTRSTAARQVRRRDPPASSWSPRSGSPCSRCWPRGSWPGCTRADPGTPLLFAALPGPARSTA